MSQEGERLDSLRHSLAHLLAAAVLDMYPDTKRAIGPAIENGFYYDLEFSSPINDSDLPKIEKKMRQILSTWKGFEKNNVSKEEALKEFKAEPYKKELIEEFSKSVTQVIWMQKYFRKTEKNSRCTSPEIIVTYAREDTSAI